MVKGYKAFEKGMICKGKQYSENTIFEEDVAEICKKGMHFVTAENPLEVLNYYPLVNNKGEISEFAEVEALDEVFTDDYKKYCTKKLRIGAKIDFPALVKAALSFEYEKINWAKIGSSGYEAKISSSGDGAQIGSSGAWAQIGSSGYCAQIGSSGNCAQIGSSGAWAKIGSSGYEAKISSSGDGAKIGSSGCDTQIGSSGDCAKIGSSGYEAKISSSGDGAQIGSSGDGAQISSSGDWVQIGSSGDGAQIGSSGCGAKIGSSGNGAVIMCAGRDSVAKAKKGSWITLSEWKKEINGKWVLVCVKTEHVDGEHIKEDTFYKLINGKFTEL